MARRPPTIVPIEVEAVKTLIGKIIVDEPFADPQPFMGTVIDNQAADQLTESFLYLLSNGGKALLLKVDDAFGLFVLPADRRLDSRAIRDELGTRRTRFASAEELYELAGLVPGGVPPFGEPILPFPLHLDAQIPQNERIAFNAGSLEHSFIMSVEAYLSVAEPARIFGFSKAPD